MREGRREEERERERELGTSKPVPSVILPPARLHLLNSANS